MVDRRCRGRDREGTVIGPHVILKGPTRIGKHNRIYQFASVGEDTLTSSTRVNRRAW